MKKHIAIHLLGGDIVKAAHAIGCSKQAVDKWRVDAYGNLKSKSVCDSVLAALVRMNYRHRCEHPDGERFPLDEDSLADLMKLPMEPELETQD